MFYVEKNKKTILIRLKCIYTKKNKEYNVKGIVKKGAILNEKNSLCCKYEER